MNVGEFLRTTTLDADDIKYAINLSKEKYFNECRKNNEIKNKSTLLELVLNNTFKKLNFISTISRTDNETIKCYIRTAREIINEEINALYNEIQRNIKSDNEIL